MDLKNVEEKMAKASKSRAIKRNSKNSYYNFSFN